MPLKSGVTGHSSFPGSVREALTINVVQPLYEHYRGLRPAYRPAARAYSEGLAFRKHALRWPEERIRPWILARLRHAVRAAYSETEFYRDRFKSIGFDPFSDFGFDDLALVPPLEREDIRLGGASLRSPRVPRRLLRWDSTGGSTGEPTEVWRGPEELGWNESGTEHFMRMIGLPRGSSTGLLWGHHLDPVASDRWRDRLRFAAENIRWFDCLRLSPEVFAQYHQQLQQWRPACIVAYAGALGTFADYLAHAAHDPAAYPTKAFVTGAEKLLPQHRAAVGSVFGLPVHERYGTRDVALIGFQLDPARSLDFTVDWANVVVEPEHDGTTSSILITKLHADAMPMIRYRVGDIAHFPSDANPGHPTLMLHEVLGREVDRIWLPDGRWVHGAAFPHLLKDYGVKLFQIVQAADFSVVLNIVPGAEYRQDANEAVIGTLRANLRDIPISLELVSDIPRTRSNKWRPVVSHVDLQQFGTR
jgi:phenylacetate-CoA ligase